MIQGNSNTRAIVIAIILWLLIIALGVGFFAFGGMRLFMGDYISLETVYMVSPTEGWAGGVIAHRSGDDTLKPAIFRYQDGKWAEFDSSFSPLVDSVGVISMSSSNEGWAAGDAAQMLHYTDGKWSVALTPIYTIKSIFTLSANNVWAVGGDAIMHYNGSKWLAETVGTDFDLEGIQVLPSAEGWAVGRNVILHYKGGKWSKDAGWQATSDLTILTSVSMLSADDGWAVGEEFLDKPKVTSHSSSSFTIVGVVYHYQNGKWQKQSSFENPNYTDLGAVKMLSPSEGWMAGRYRSDSTIASVIMHYKDGDWSEQARVGALAIGGDLFMTSANEGWAVLGQHILHYKDGNWNE